MPANISLRSIVVFILCVMILIFCLPAIPSTKDLSKTLPYSEAIGKRFVIKQDMYVYQYTNDDMNLLGSINDLGRVNPDTPHVVDSKYIGKRAGNVIIKAVVKEGQTIILSRVLRETGFESSYMRFRILVVGDPYFSKHESDGASLVNSNFNPPKTAHWSDPPIFKAELVEPFPSDGIWWK